jgi:hypothetical protein
MRRRSRIFVASASVLLGLAGSLSLALAATLPSAALEPRSTLLTDGYRLDASITFHEALLHWLDSLAEVTGPGFTAGKTVAAHRAEFEAILGRPSGTDTRMLSRYHQARRAIADGAPSGDRNAVALAFFESASLEEALGRLGELGDPGPVAELTAALRHFQIRYRPIWKDGHVPRTFAERVLASARRDELAEMLARIARFLGVPAEESAAARLVLVPVSAGQGTHAQVIGRHLLIEVRPGEGLEDEVAPIVHENVHFLVHRIPAERRAALERAALAAGPHGGLAWETLGEALPTALGQGIAGRAFLGESWSTEDPWYHLVHVDVYAKRILPLLDEALREGTAFDEALVPRLVEVHPLAASPRSP